MPESSLYPAVKAFLTARGYDVKGEIGPCDIVGIKPGEPRTVMITELKLGFSLDLVLQGVDRLACADEVWLAVQATRRGRDRDRRVRTLCKLLGFGLLAVHPARNDVQVLAEPEPYRPRPNLRRRKRLVAEHSNRRGDPATGGTRGIPILTAYRQEALACAARLRDGPLPTKALKSESPRATAILYRNPYGWFERVGRGVYGLTPDGETALHRWAERTQQAEPDPCPEALGAAVPSSA
jgi:hypothetical protein